MSHSCEKCGHTSERSPDDLLDDGIRALRAAYYSHVRDVAEDIVKRYRAGEFATRDDLLTDIHETVDGDAWIIYTRKAQIVAMVSDNDSAVEDMGIESAMDRDGIKWSVIAFCAMERDVYDAIAAGGDDWEGIDVNAEPCDTCKGSGKCDDGACDGCDGIGWVT